MSDVLPVKSMQRTLYDRSPEFASMPISVRMSLAVKGLPHRSGELETTYNEDAWHARILALRFLRNFAGDLPSAKSDMVHYDLDSYKAAKVEEALEKEGMSGIAVPHFYNPVHSSFVSYRSLIIDRKLVLFQQFSVFYRYAVVPDLLLEKCGLDLNPSYAW